MLVSILMRSMILSAFINKFGQFVENYIKKTSIWYCYNYHDLSSHCYKQQTHNNAWLSIVLRYFYLYHYSNLLCIHDLSISEIGPSYFCSSTGSPLHKEEWEFILKFWFPWRSVQRVWLLDKQDGCWWIVYRFFRKLPSVPTVAYSQFLFPWTWLRMWSILWQLIIFIFFQSSSNCWSWFEVALLWWYLLTIYIWKVCTV